MSDSSWNRVVRALLGTWPSQVAAWGEEGIAAYVEELQARGLSPESALTAIRSYESAADFPPSASKLAAQARSDPSRPTFDEAYAMIYNAGGICGFKRAGVVVSPWVVAFAECYGIDRLKRLEIDHPQYGDIKRKELRQSWEDFLEATEGRAIAELVSGSRRGHLERFDPLALIGQGG